MILLTEFDKALMRARGLARSRRPSAHWKSLQRALEAAAWTLSEEIGADERPPVKEARRQLRIETAALLSEIELSLRNPTQANRNCVDHRVKVWNELLQQLRRNLGLSGTADRGNSSPIPSPVARAAHARFNDE